MRTNRLCLTLALLTASVVVAAPGKLVSPETRLKTGIYSSLRTEFSRDFKSSFTRKAIRVSGPKVAAAASKFADTEFGDYEEALQEWIKELPPAEWQAFDKKTTPLTDTERKAFVAAMVKFHKKLDVVSRKKGRTQERRWAEIANEVLWPKDKTVNR